MCGICGFIGGEQKTEVLKSMMEAIRHRGPDENGIFEGDGVSLGFCRLSIIDLKSGNQPIFNEDKTLSLVFNGEIYNYKELREELKDKERKLQYYYGFEAACKLIFGEA